MQPRAQIYADCAGIPNCSCLKLYDVIRALGSYVLKKNMRFISL